MKLDMILLDKFDEMPSILEGYFNSKRKQKAIQNLNAMLTCCYYRYMYVWVNFDCELYFALSECEMPWYYWGFFCLMDRSPHVIIETLMFGMFIKIHC